LIPVAVHAFNPGPMTGEGNSTWLIRGPVPTLIDAGVGEPRHLDALQDALGGDRLAHVLVTHGHGDHASGAPAIAARMPGVAFLKMPWPERDARVPVSWQSIGDGEVIQAGDTSLLAIHTPGHAPDHLCFWHEQSRTLFGGDLAIEGTTVWIPASLQGDMAAYMSSLERTASLNPGRILPAHGPVIDDPVPLLRRYLSHRRRREEQVLDGLRRGYTRVDAIVEQIYRGLAPSLVSRAAGTVTAHLVKLEREGRARADADAWHIIDP
jgi:glyoxylase-like metal-dependent hydrolase (beta-lactamase superfamily II)